MTTKKAKDEGQVWSHKCHRMLRYLWEDPCPYCGITMKEALAKKRTPKDEEDEDDDDQ